MFFSLNETSKPQFCLEPFTFIIFSCYSLSSVTNSTTVLVSIPVCDLGNLQEKCEAERFIPVRQFYRTYNSKNWWLLSVSTWNLWLSSGFHSFNEKSTLGNVSLLSGSFQGVFPCFVFYCCCWFALFLIVAGVLFCFQKFNYYAHFFDLVLWGVS